MCKLTVSVACKAKIDGFSLNARLGARLARDGYWDSMLRHPQGSKSMSSRAAKCLRFNHTHTILSRSWDLSEALCEISPLYGKEVGSARFYGSLSPTLLKPHF
jgi:hypothetical protein